jgi:hypothetical protein
MFCEITDDGGEKRGKRKEKRTSRFSLFSFLFSLFSLAFVVDPEKTWPRSTV